MTNSFDPDEIVIFRASMIDPHTGVRRYAKDEGKRAFRIVIKRKKPPKGE